jgi:hypothetical protein
MSLPNFDSATQLGSGSEWVDPVIAAYKVDVDRSLLRQALQMTPHERLSKLQRLCAFAEELRRAGEWSRSKAK